jgi:hypothetical protein
MPAEPYRKHKKRSGAKKKRDEEEEEVRKTFHVAILLFSFLAPAGGLVVPLPYPYSIFPPSPILPFLATYQRRACAREIASLLFLPLYKTCPTQGWVGFKRDTQSKKIYL